LRHTYATNLLDDSRDIRLVAQALGHSDVRITMRYTERGNEEVAEALEKSRSKKKS
jgi:integrase/recombinase XerD